MCGPGDNQQEVAQKAASQTIRNACIEEATSKAKESVEKSAKVAAGVMVQKVMLDTIKEEAEARRAKLS